mmetsp:Transcript_7652/g.10557  ORF Transcript_7652/g.10557 Transcript_7652/m.10557 type:complete len:936 (+) Transcript_7652:74-2881(+)
MELSSKDHEVNEVIADFEIVDYTCASPWEKFIASLEDVFRGWMVQIHQDEKKLSEEGSDSDESNSFVESSKVVANEQQKYQLTLYRANRRPSPTSTTGYLDDTINSMMDWNLDFPSHAHHLQRWFGITTFITISRFQSDLEISPSEAAMLLSSVHIATSNILTSYNFTNEPSDEPQQDKVPEFNIPVFIPIHERWKGTYVGAHKIDNLAYVTSKSHHANKAHNAEDVAVVASFGMGVDIRFDSDVSTSPPSSITHNNINGLLDLYETTLGHITYENRNEYNNEGRQMIHVAARFTYMKTLDDYWADEKHEEHPDNQNKYNNYNDVMSKQDTIMMPSTRDAYNDISSEFSLFPFDDPLEALHLGVTWYNDSLEHLYNEDDFDVEDAPQWLLRVIYAKKPLAMISESVETLTKAIKVSVGLDTVSQVVNLGQNNAPPQPLFEAVSSMSSLSRSINELPSAEEIDLMLKQLLHPQSTQIPLVPDLAPYEIKAAPPRSLLSFLSINLLNARGLRGMALLWWEFAKELRWYWENAALVPRVFTSERIASNSNPEDINRIESIDLKYCLIYQKLQMLNHCIEHKQHYNKIKATAEKEDPFHQKPSDGSGWDDFDVDISDEETTNQNKAPKSKLTNDGSIGELEGLASLTTGAPLRKPKTQVFGLMTEDMIAEQVEIFSKLGTSEDAMKIRARLQSASLLSDMQAFKACNPGCCLEDFIRWHSPNDWVNGQLSARMETPGNLWKQMWEEATPLPVSQQPPIFDYITIAEKILHYLETIAPSELLKQILRVALGTIYNHFAHNEFSKIPAIQERIAALSELLKQYSENEDTFPTIVETISSIEILLNKAKSLQKKFGNADMLMELLFNGEVAVAQPTRPGILALFTDKHGKLPHPDAREFILRSMLKPATNLPTSKKMGNRLYILLTPSEFRLATAQMQLTNS